MGGWSEDDSPTLDEERRATQTANGLDHNNTSRQTRPDTARAQFSTDARQTVCGESEVALNAFEALSAQLVKYAEDIRVAGSGGLPSKPKVGQMDPTKGAPQVSPSDSMGIGSEETGEQPYQEVEVYFDGKGTSVQPLATVQQVVDLCHSAVVENINRAQLEWPVLLQCYTVPTLLAGHSLLVIGRAGKLSTSQAFLLPLVSILCQCRVSHCTRYNYWPANVFKGEWCVRPSIRPAMIVLMPTSERAIKVYSEAIQLCFKTGLQVALGYDGAESGYLLNRLHEGCHVLVATRGALNRWMQQGVAHVDHVRWLVADWGGTMLTGDFFGDTFSFLKKLCTRGGQQHVQLPFVLVADGIDDDCKYMVQSIGNAAFELLVCQGQTLAESVLKHSVEYVDGHSSKFNVLLSLLAQHVASPTVVFVRSNEAAEQLRYQLLAHHVTASLLHRGQSQQTQKSSIDEFLSRGTLLMVSTDLLCMGVNVRGVQHVINYDLPNNPSVYRHRMECISCNGKTGLVTSILTPETHKWIPILREFIESSELSHTPTWLQELSNVIADAPRWLDDGVTQGIFAASHSGEQFTLIGLNSAASTIQTMFGSCSLGERCRNCDDSLGVGQPSGSRGRVRARGGTSRGQRGARRQQGRGHSGFFHIDRGRYSQGDRFGAMFKGDFRGHRYKHGRGNLRRAEDVVFGDDFGFEDREALSGWHDEDLDDDW